MRQEFFNLQYALAKEKHLKIDSPGWKPQAEQAKDIPESLFCDKGNHIYDLCQVTVRRRSQSVVCGENGILWACVS
jgi:hypothetical protein